MCTTNDNNVCTLLERWFLYFVLGESVQKQSLMG